MKSLLVFLLAAWLMGSAPFCLLRAAQADEERQLILVLQSDRAPAEKDAACAKLKRLATAQAVPALAALLADEQLSHSARYALESVPAPEAERALVEALDKTAGLTKVGIINSLAFRGEPQAVPPLAPLLNAPDPAVASAAATALGQIGGPEALQALEAAARNSAGQAQIHEAAVDALLRCAHGLLRAGDPAKALPVFQRLCETEKKDHFRLAAYRGLLLASGQGALPLILEALADQPGPRRTAALQLVRDLDAPGATAAFAQLLPKLAPPTQVALLEGLSQRQDPAAVPAITPLARHASPGVRLAAINALGILGDASSVAPLAEAAASATGAEQEAARQSLLQLQRGNPAAALLAQLASARPAVQAELARALGERGETAALPKLLELARQGSESARQAALRALALLADQPQLDSLVALVLEANADAPRAQAAEALRSACQRLQSKRGRLDAAPLVNGLAAGSAAARIALLPVCSALADPQVRAALRAALDDSNPQVRTAALRALCDTLDAELLPDLVKAASQTPEAPLRSLAIGACVRLTTQEETIKLPDSQRLGALKTILAARLTPDQKRRVLAGLGEIPDPQALALAEPLLAEAAVQNEAGRAIIKIAPALSDAATAAAALKKVLAATRDAATRQAAEAALKELEARADFITAWQVAGPYRQAGKNYAALFDIAFPPEAAAAEPGADALPTEPVNWQTLPPGADPKRPWSMDLLKALGGEQCVAYARTWIFSEHEQPTRLELGSDDGVKVWLNYKQVHANNTARPLQPGSDQLNVTLKPGWNPLLLKITQNNLAWEFCARLVKPDGSRLAGLQFDAHANPQR
ncbi:MAG: HEAT repeat domain-containing protein [Verrucomicrobiota bacterium]|jgi:HEAT repeat protein